MTGTIRTIAFIGNYLPRQCGIATFTTDICESVASAHPELSCFAVPVNDIPEGYAYPSRVRFEIRENDLSSYRRAADFLNINNPDVVSLQHEYGIFGGDDGIYILSLLRRLRMPIITTLHTVLKDPTARQRRILLEIAERSSFLVVMAKKAVDFLTSIYGIPPAKIRLIQHGIPDMPFIDPNFYKDQFGVAGKTVLLTFGLLSPNKGIEQVIRAIPDIVRVNPNLVYIVLGATHPSLLRHEGEAYRLTLQRLIAELKIEKHVLFRNRFVSAEELKEFLVMADVYITPYLGEAQITSGTLAYSFGIGNAVISTPYWHAEELLADGRGILIPFNSPSAISEAVNRLVGNDAERNMMRKNAYLAGRDMIWPRVAHRYVETFEEARMTRQSTASCIEVFSEEEQHELPEQKLDHIKRLTDRTGIIQHAKYTVPNFSEGYCTDDNARALVLMVMLASQSEETIPDVDILAGTYLAALQYAFDDGTKRFRNFLRFDRTWVKEAGSEDSHGRALWALGTCLGRSKNVGFQGAAGVLFEQGLATVRDFSSPRAWAFAILGIHEYLRRFSGDRFVNQIREQLSERLYALYRLHATPDWPWFEDELTYVNAKLSHALILSGRWLSNNEMLKAGLGSLSWLIGEQTAPSGHFRPIGANEPYRRGMPRPLYDQQPIEAKATISACMEAFRVTGEKQWHREAERAFRWFLGGNDLSLSIYDAATGGCRDGLHVDRLNQNEGAESTLAFHLALAEMSEIEKSLALKEPLAE
ncbi:MAG: glycosyltransferase family 4 protein [Spirochaetota bacterium]